MVNVNCFPCELTDVLDKRASFVPDISRVGRVGLDPGQHCRDEVALDVTNLTHLQIVGVIFM